LKVVALAGGTGSAKLLRGLSRLGADLSVVANVGDNFWVYGMYVCPDLDISTYALAGIQDVSRGWGIRGDTFEALAQLSSLGQETWFRLGDRDMAASMLRTKMMREGSTLTEASRAIGGALGVKQEVLPVTDDSLETWVSTPAGDLHLQEFWVRERGLPTVKGVSYRGSRSARLTPQAARAVAAADRVVVCPANPVTSIGPMLAVGGLKSALVAARARVVALSPMEGGAPFSGPAGKLLRARGVEPSSVGVARLYSEFLDLILVSRHDSEMAGTIGDLGVESRCSNIRLSGRADEERLARELLEA
jgi:LPPG:FO 2-phospho-L-lactate transferase